MTMPRSSISDPSTGATVTLDMDAARVIVATDRFRLDLTVTLEHVAIGYVGEYDPVGFAAILLLDMLHERNLLPTDPAALSVQQLADIADLRADQREAPAA